MRLASLLKSLRICPHAVRTTTTNTIIIHSTAPACPNVTVTPTQLPQRSMRSPNTPRPVPKIFAVVGFKFSRAMSGRLSGCRRIWCEVGSRKITALALEGLSKNQKPTGGGGCAYNYEIRGSGLTRNGCTDFISPSACCDSQCTKWRKPDREIRPPHSNRNRL